MQGEFERDRYRYKRRDYAVAKPRPASRPPQSDNLPEESKKVVQKPARKSGSRKKLLLSVLVLFIVLGAAIGGWLFLKNKDSGPIPKEIRQSVNFPLYYPSSLPAGYSLDKKSINNAEGIVFFKLISATDFINISEQAAPSNPPDFDALQKSNTSFRNLAVVGGHAIYGVSQGVPVAFLITNTTMININGAKKTPSDIIAKLIQSMASSF